MLLPEFDFHEPVTLKDALLLKNKYRGDAKILAGGTDLLVHMKKNWWLLIILSVCQKSKSYLI